MPSTPTVRNLVIDGNLIGTGQIRFGIPGTLLLTQGSSYQPATGQTGLAAQSNGRLAAQDSSNNFYQLALSSELATISGVVVAGNHYISLGSIQDGGIIQRVGNSLVTVSGYTGSYVNAQDGLTYTYQSGILMSRV